MEFGALAWPEPRTTEPVSALATAKVVLRLPEREGRASEMVKSLDRVATRVGAPVRGLDDGLPRLVLATEGLALVKAGVV
jgi:hypothetical protein